MRLYRCEPTALKLLVPHTPLVVVKTGRELFSINLALRTRVGKAECRERGTQASCERGTQASRKRATQASREAADARLANMSSNVHELVKVWKRQTASNVSGEELTAELKKVKVYLI